MSAPSVYTAINAVSAELATSGIPKRHVNEIDDYRYRSIDDVFDRLAPLLAAHRLCVLPRVLERVVSERRDDAGQFVVSVALRIAYSLTSAEDGSSHTVEVYGEALDTGDKATAKAMSAAYKSVMVQTFCVPVPATDDPDRTAQKLSRAYQRQPEQGWVQWCIDLKDIISLCETEQAITLIQDRNRDFLKALSRERPELYKRLGASFAGRREDLKAVEVNSKARSSPAKRPRRKSELQHA